MRENRYTAGKYFNIFTPETSRVKDKSVIGAQLVYKYITNCLLLAEREVHCSLYSSIITYVMILILLYIFQSIPVKFDIYIYIYTSVD